MYTYHELPSIYSHYKVLYGLYNLSGNYRPGRIFYFPFRE